jgi:hypothetical protein
MKLRAASRHLVENLGYPLWALAKSVGVSTASVAWAF